MREKFSFLYVDIWFDLMQCELIVKNSSFKMLVMLSPIFMADTKVTFIYNFVAPLKVLLKICRILLSFWLKYHLSMALCMFMDLINFRISWLLKWSDHNLSWVKNSWLDGSTQPFLLKNLLKIFAFDLISVATFCVYQKRWNQWNFFIIIKCFENGPIRLYLEQLVIQLSSKVLIEQYLGGID